jgi:hypothetical protein
MPWTVCFTFEDVNSLFGPLKYMRIFKTKNYSIGCHHVENDKKRGLGIFKNL